MEIDQLIAQLGAADVAARRAAAEALSRSGATDAILPLIQACADPDDQVREWAGTALEELGPPPREIASALAAALNEEGASAYFAATLLGRLAADAAPWAIALGEAVETNSDQAVRERAAWALGKIGPAASAASASLETAARDGGARLARLAKAALEKIGAAS